MKRKMFCLLLAGALVLAGCSLARPEKEEAGEDVFCGFYVVPYPRDEGTDFYENPNLTAYGTEALNAEGFGELTFDRQVLFGVTDEAGNVTFPGMEGGYSLFLYRYTTPEGTVDGVQSNMGPGEEMTQISVTDEGVEKSASGTIYVGPPLGAEPDWAERDNGTVWQFYRVWQTQDERLYLDGSGNSYGGANGGGWTVSEDQTFKRAENGETVEETTVTISVKIELVPRLEKLTVYQYGPEGLLSADEMALTTEAMEFTCQAGTRWVVVEETTAGGTAKHTAYDLANEDISHGVVLLDEQGWGTYTTLTITK